MMLKFLQYTITTSLPINIDNPKLLINTINPHSYCVAKKDSEFENSLISCDILIPDGIGIVLAFRVLYGKKIDRISGYDLHMHYLNLVNEKGGKVFYLGSNESTLQSIQQRVKSQFPKIQVETFSPPYKAEFTNEDSQEMLATVNSFKPDVLFIGMTAPKQEKWSFKFKDQLDAQAICSIGAVFDFYAGTVKRPSEVWINLGLEWLPRLIREPRRLWKRTFISTPSFLSYIFFEKIIHKKL
jgi:N-acetylglucosaminyldiphosphoundecaprenol N-acetyl-beta-D-mannosaminyltransferase